MAKGEPRIGRPWTWATQAQQHVDHHRQGRNNGNKTTQNKSMRETCAYSQTDSALIKLAIAHTGHTHNNDSALEDPVVAELFLQSLDCRQTLPAVALLDAHVHIILCSGASTRVLSICLGKRIYHYQT